MRPFQGKEGDSGTAQGTEVTGVGSEKEQEVHSSFTASDTAKLVTQLQQSIKKS